MTVPSRLSPEALAEITARAAVQDDRGAPDWIADAWNDRNSLLAHIAAQDAEIARLKAERDAALAELSHEAADARNLRELVLRLGPERDAARAQVEKLRATLRLAWRLPRPWMDGGITEEEWGHAVDTINAALRTEPKP